MGNFRNNLKVARRLEYTLESRSPDEKRRQLGDCLEKKFGGENGCSLVINTPNKKSLMQNGVLGPRTPELKVLGKGTFGTVVKGVYQGNFCFVLKCKRVKVR